MSNQEIIKKLEVIENKLNEISIRMDATDETYVNLTASVERLLHDASSNAKAPKKAPAKTAGTASGTAGASAAKTAPAKKVTIARLFKDKMKSDDKFAKDFIEEPEIKELLKTAKINTDKITETVINKIWTAFNKHGKTNAKKPENAKIAALFKKYEQELSK